MDPKWYKLTEYGLEIIVEKVNWSVIFQLQLKVLTLD